MPVPGIVGWWLCNEGSGNTVADSSGNANPGTFSHQVGGNDPTWTTGQFSAAAVQFNGPIDAGFVDIGNPGILSLSDWTIMTWFMTPSSLSSGAANPALFTRSTGGPSFFQNYVLEVRTNDIPMSFAVGSDADSYLRVTSTTVPSTNTWYHIAGSFNSVAKLFTVYVNGVAENTGTTVGVPTQAGAQEVVIGAASAGTDAFLLGKTYDSRIYNRALTAQEVFGIYEGSFPESEPVGILRGSHHGSRITPPYNP